MPDFTKLVKFVLITLVSLLAMAAPAYALTAIGNAVMSVLLAVPLGTAVLGAAFPVGSAAAVGLLLLGKVHAERK